MRDAIDTKTLRAAFVQAQAQIMNNGTYTPVVFIDKGMALQLLDEIERQQRWIEEATPLLDDWNALARESFLLNDQIEYLKSLLADLLTDCENWGCAPNERYAEALR